MPARTSIRFVISIGFIISSSGTHILMCGSMLSRPGTGCHGNPFTCSSISQSYFNLSPALLLMVLTFIVPSFVPFNVSPLSSLIPIQTPARHLLFNLLTLTLFGIMYHTHPPHGAASILKLLPFNLCLGVLPSGPMKYLFKLCAACGTNHTNTSLFSFMFVLYLACNCDLIVLNYPWLCLSAYSTSPLLGLSPTGDTSGTI